MRSLLFSLTLCLLLGTNADARHARPKAAEQWFVVVDEWRVDGDEILFDGERLKVDLFWLADRLQSDLIDDGGKAAYEPAMRKVLRDLDPKLPLHLEIAAKKKGGQKFIAGAWQMGGDQIAKDLRLNLSGPKQVAAGEPLPLAVTLENKGKAAHRVVLPNDGSESGWREPEVYFEMLVAGRWVRGNPLPRCGMFAEDWHRDVRVLAPGGKAALNGYLPPNLTFDLKKKGRYRLRARYVYRRGKTGRGPQKKVDPGPMGKTPAFELVSNEVEVAVK